MLTFPQKMTILPQLVNISSQKVMFTPKYVDLRALSSVVASRIYAFFVVKSILEVEAYWFLAYL